MPGSGCPATVDLQGLPPSLRHLRRRITRAADRVLRSHGAGAYTVSITFVNDRKMAALNRRALGRRGATDVIAFDLSEAGLPCGIVADLYVSLDRARAAKQAFGASEDEEIIRLVIHGLLHVVGYRDDSAGRRRVMQAAQENLVDVVLPRRATARGSR